MNHRLIAINLPQFHPFPENDEWWGKGFTEWTNVTKARPRFKGHYQPHLPADTGFYDLRLPEARQMQADMAKEYGIYGFCYYHYWFNGKQLMERPVNDILKSGEPDFPFMLCWANENWARNWDGGFHDILIEQKYTEEDDKEHIRWLCKNVFSDKRYIRIKGKPVFAIYRIDCFPNFKHTVSVWRTISKEEFNMDIYLINAEFPMSPTGKEALCQGLDASFDFQPMNVYKYLTPLPKYNLIKNSYQKLYRSFPWIRNWERLQVKIDALPDLYSYSKYVDQMKKTPMPNYKLFPCVCPGWDNSPRRTGGFFMAFVGSTPSLYQEWLQSTIQKFIPYSDEENFVFINAWNEWAEGNHLEPDQLWGKGYLEATIRAIKNCQNK